MSFLFFRGGGDRGDDRLCSRIFARGVASKNFTLVLLVGVVTGEAGGQASFDLDAETCGLEEWDGGT